MAPYKLSRGVPVLQADRARAQPGLADFLSRWGTPAPVDTLVRSSSSPSRPPSPPPRRLCAPRHPRVVSLPTDSVCIYAD